MMEESIAKNQKKKKFGERVDKNMEHENQGYNTSDRCPRNDTHKVKNLVKVNRN